jgi:DNA-binding transcriptional MerR regulator
MGRPTLYDAALVEEMREVTADGWTMREIAEELGVDPRTVRLWRTKFLEFRRALKAGRAEHTRRVAAERRAQALQKVTAILNDPAGTKHADPETDRDRNERERHAAQRAADAAATREAVQALGPLLAAVEPVRPADEPSMADPDTWQEEPQQWHEDQSTEAEPMRDPLAD